MVLNAMGPVDLIFGFMLTSLAPRIPVDPGVTQRYSPSSVVVEQVGFNTGGLNAFALRS